MQYVVVATGTQAVVGPFDSREAAAAVIRDQVPHGEIGVLIPPSCAAGAAIDSAIVGRWGLRDGELVRIR